MCERGYNAMDKFPETIIEIYDDEPICNILSIVKFKPKNAIYIVPREILNERVTNNITGCLKKLGIGTRCFFRAVNMDSVDDITAELGKILSKYPDSAVEICGGYETALVAIGMMAREKRIPLFKYDRKSRCYRDFYRCPSVEGICGDPKFNIGAFLSLSGAAMKSHGHISIDSLDRESSEDILTVFKIYSEHYRGWHRTVAYLQQISKDLEPHELHVSARQVMFGEEAVTTADKKVMSALCEAGIIKNYRNSPRSTSFSYKNRLMKSCLTDIGICLEIYVFAALLESKRFDDVMISVVIDWDGKLYEATNTINEIDVMAVKGAVPLFISCKSGTPNVTALNEIKTLASQFGGKHSKAVLVTMSDVKEKDRYFAQRAEDMGIILMGRNELLSAVFAEKLAEAALM